VAIDGVDVSGSHNGGTTAVSAASVALRSPISAVNDAPIASGGATLPGGTAGETPESDTVGNLFGPTFSDKADQQRTADNPTGSVSNTHAGVVVVGNTTPASQGTWRYSTDDGVTWTAIPTTVSDVHGLVLGNNVRLAFFSSPDFAGKPPPLMVRLVDSSTDVPLAGAVTGSFLSSHANLVIADVDVSGGGNGGNTAVSANEVPLDTKEISPPPNPPVPPPPFPPPLPPPFFWDQDGGFEPAFLVGGSVYRTLITDQPGVVNVSADVFSGGDIKDLTFEASSVSGGPLPPWLYFDPSLVRFTGTPPDSAEGTLDLRITARDRQGRTAVAEVHVVILRPPRDIFSLLRPPSDHLAKLPPAPPPPPTPPAPEAAPPADKAPPSPDATPATPDVPPTPGTPPANDAPASGARTMNEESIRGFGLSPQLREQSLAGRLARSRALLNALGQGRPVA
jgi:hypothetical protein